MAPTFTTKLGLAKPDPGDLYDITIPNGNMDILDRSGTIVCTSGSRPSSPYRDMTIFETDTGHVKVWVPGSPGLWTSVGNGLRGGKRYDTVNANLATLASGSAATEALAGMDTGAVVLEGSRMHKVSVQVEAASSVAGDSLTFRIRLTNLAGGVWALYTTPAMRAANVKQHFEFSALVPTNSTAGARTFVLTVQRASGSGSVLISSSTADVKPYMIIEQVSPDTLLTVV